MHSESLFPAIVDRINVFAVRDASGWWHLRLISHFEGDRANATHEDNYDLLDIGEAVDVISTAFLAIKP